MLKKALPKSVVGPMNKKYIVGPMNFPKGVTPEALAKVIGPMNVIGPNNIKSVVGLLDDTLGIELTASSLKHVNVALLTDNDVVLLHCKVCGTEWVPVLEKDKRLPPGWWSCPKDEKHSKK